MRPSFPERRQPALVHLRTATGDGSDSLVVRAVRLLPFAVVWVVVNPVALLLPGAVLRTDLLVLSTALAALTAAFLLVEPPARRVHLWRTAPTVTAVAAVLVLRHAGGGSDTGFGDALLVLPAVYQGLYGRWTDVAVAVGAVVAGLAVPVLVLDGYPPHTEVPRGLVIVVVAALLGILLASLVEALHEHDDLIDRLGAVTYLLHATDSPRTVVCDAVRQLAGAPTAVLFEQDHQELIATATAGTGLPAPTDPPVQASPGAAAALASGRLAFERGDADGHAADGHSADGHGTGGWPGSTRLHVPIGTKGETVAVVTVAWPDQRTEPARTVMEGLALLGADGARAIERSDLLARLNQQANRDGLTGLLNRRGWDRVLQNEVADAHREHRPVTLALFDLDRFKDFNDHFGHLAGDDLLEEAAAAWTRELRSGDVLARWGGEEFAVLFPSGNADAAVRALDRLRRVTPHDQRFSAGVVSAAGARVEALMAAADAALYRAKQQGRDRTVVAEPGDLRA